DPRWRGVMTSSQQESNPDSASRVVDAIESVEQSALEAVRKFVDTVDGAFPDVGEDGPRRKIIDSAFKMTEQLVGASNQFARNIVKVTGEALEEPDSSASPKTTKTK
ncbi:MAG: hypothetical protein ACXW1S_07715, partial [Acidimicrobiia bacterium]